MKLTEIVIVLCRPADPGNIGAVCRAMMNMGLGELRITGLSREDLTPFEGEIRSRAVHAAGIWEETRFFDSLEKAAADCAFLAGTTRRRGRKRKNVTMDSRDLALWLRDRPGRAALAFGSERSGLDDGELALCNIASHIPVSGAFPSLNLSHAVQIYGYELFRALGPGGPAEEGGDGAAGRQSSGTPVRGAWTPLNRQEADALAASITGNLETLGFYRHPGREEQRRFIRDLVSRAALSQKEGKYLGDIFAKTARLAARGGPGRYDPAGALKP
ncbi:MAG: RNA methyltransferase [Treponema sp.]|jgi:tRNA/rRNA methyltransferase/tRNA (cytidine32/uridine32-2'-O)-methyltransferase|nr:RNA methyltransferase [Treponema sp.]